MPYSFKPNEAGVLTELFRRGPQTRADLARHLDLTRSTAGNLVQGLIEGGFVQERSGLADGGARVGRPGVAVEIRGDGAIFLGAEIGVDRIEVLTIDLAGEVRASADSAHAGAASTPAGTVRLVRRLVRRAIAALPSARKVHGLSVAVPGFPTAEGRSIQAKGLGWHGVPLADLLAGALGGGHPILIENDANAFAVAETYRPGMADQGPEDVLVVLLENGVGGGILQGGRLHRGLLGGAGEIGHMPVGGEGFLFDDRRPGRLETYVGKNALLARDAHRRGEAARPLDAFLEALRQGEPEASATAREWGTWLARGLAIATMVLQPQRIILGGSLAPIFDHVSERVRTLVGASLIDFYPVPTIQATAPAQGRPALGAALLLHQSLLAGETPRARAGGEMPERPSSDLA